MSQDGNSHIGEREHRIAVGMALFVTVLWSSSWVIIKFGLRDLPPITFSGLRYVVASFVLMLYIGFQKKLRQEMTHQSKRWWLTLVAYGLVFVAITQGAQFIGLALLDAITVSLLLNMTPLLVLIIGAASLQEKPKAREIGFIIVGILGVLLYFYPIELPLGRLLGLVVVIIGVVANAAASVMGRAINRSRETPPIIITGISITMGSLALLATGILVEGIVFVGPVSLLYVLWLGVVNTALAFTVWNKAMQTLRAIDVSIINSTMLPQIVFLSIVFLGELPSGIDYIGLIFVGISVFMVQWSQAQQLKKDNC